VFQTIQSQLREAKSSIRTGPELLDRQSNVGWPTDLAMFSFILSIISGLGAVSFAKADVMPYQFHWPLAWMLEGIMGIFALIWLSTRD